jgi:origin recognition complex subunit 5
MDARDVEDLIARLTEANPGYENLIFQVTSLVTTYPPPFLYINDPTTPRIASSVLRSLLSECSKLPLSASPQIRFAHVNAAACFTARIFYDTVLNAMAQWHVKWEDGCENWSDEGSGQRWNESMDGFLHGLKAIYAAMGKGEASKKMDGKGKGKQKDTVDGNVHWGGDSRMVLIVDRAERLKETLPDLMVPLTRLTELVSFPNDNCPVIFSSMPFMIFLSLDSYVGEIDTLNFGLPDAYPNYCYICLRCAMARYKTSPRRIPWSLSY